MQGSCKSNHTFFDGCPVVVADDHTSCLHEANTPGTACSYGIQFSIDTFVIMQCPTMDMKYTVRILSVLNSMQPLETAFQGVGRQGAIRNMLYKIHKLTMPSASQSMVQQNLFNFYHACHFTLHSIHLGSQYWCKDSEILHTDHGFLFCPPVDEVLLRVPKEEITSVEQLPKPGHSQQYSGLSDTFTHVRGVTRI